MAKAALQDLLCPHTFVVSGGAMHVGDIDGTTVSLQNTWSATVTITLHDEGHRPLANAMVSASWTSRSSAPRTVPPSIAPANNHDPDGGSNGTTISIFEAVARLSTRIHTVAVTFCDRRPLTYRCRVTGTSRANHWSRLRCPCADDGHSPSETRDHCEPFTSVGSLVVRGWTRHRGPDCPCSSCRADDRFRRHERT